MKQEPFIHTLSTKERLAYIKRILALTRRAVPNIVPAVRMKHLDTGKLYSLFGMPFNFDPDRYEQVIIGYVYQDKYGTTYGTVKDTMQAQADHWNQCEDSNAAAFKEELLAMTEERFAECVQHWLHEPPIPCAYCPAGH